jgi:hypothetical protein
MAAGEGIMRLVQPQKAEVVPLHDHRRGQARCPTCHRHLRGHSVREVASAVIKWTVIGTALLWAGVLGLGLWLQPPKGAFGVFVFGLALWLLWRAVAFVWALLEGWRPWRAHAYVEHADQMGSEP